MPSRVNKLMVKEAVERYRSAGAMVAVAYVGLGAGEATTLRRKLGADDVDLRVVKNHVTKIAMRELGREEFCGFLEGETAVITCGDPLGASKAAVEFTKARRLELKGGWVEGKTLSKEEVRRLAKIPAKNVLLGQIAGLAAGSLARLVGMVRAPYASIARAVRAWNEGREGPEQS